MDEETEIKAIKKWLRVVDKPLEPKEETKEADNKDEEAREESGNRKNDAVI